MGIETDRYGFQYEVPDMELVSSVPEGEVIVSMVSKGDGIIVATNKYVYTMAEDKVMRRVMFEVEV